MVAIEKRLREGPVHLTKRNKLAAIVLEEQRYQELLRGGRDAEQPGMTALQWLLSQPFPGSESRIRLKRERRGDRQNWG